METDYERRLREMVEQVQACESLRVDTYDRGPLADYMERAEDAFHIVRAVEKTPLPTALTSNFHRHSGLVFAWRALEPFQTIAGEFHLRHIGEALLLGAGKKPVAATASQEERLIHGFRIFETHPVGGTGTYTAMRLTPDQAPPELWYFDLRQGPTRLDLGYGDYLDTLLRTKGLYDWPYLFADPDPNNYGMSVSLPYLSEGLDLVAREFPDDDLSDLRGRLEERMSVLGKDA
ncbi:hypothetical protein [Streptomyces sp. NBC_00236]|uniref:hypothetical protein n=1 Tax=Streptomyces sp. NBC_00236 TaxID=2903639 RepID=UPI002E29986C|nr:hypothetical protein [Streptomyces sp. NBC_00236]